MPAPRKYPEELKERATRLAVDARRDATTRRGAIARIAGQLDIHPEALRGWVRGVEAVSLSTSPLARSRAANDDGEVEQVSDRQRILELEARNRELIRANLILRQAATFSELRSEKSRGLEAVARIGGVAALGLSWRARESLCAIQLRVRGSRSADVDAAVGGGLAAGGSSGVVRP